MSTAPFLAPHRDEGLRRGRIRGDGTTHYQFPEGMPQTTTTLSTILNTDLYCPIMNHSHFAFDQVGMEVTTGASATLRIGMYRADGDWQPTGPPLFDSGTIDTTSTGVKTYAPSTAVFVPPGRYLQVLNASSSSPAIRVFRVPSVGIANTLGGSPVINHMTAPRTYAAFATPGTAWTALVSSTTAGGYAFFGFRYTG